MTETTPNLGLPELDAAQAQKHVTHNEALHVLDALVQLAVLDRDLASPPGAPDEGERWIVGASATGDWAGRDNAIAVWLDAGWDFHAPRIGFLCYVADEEALLAWDGSAWVDAIALLSELQNVTLLGVGTAADATNPFSAKLNNALWVAKTVAAGGDGDLRYKMSKESASKTLSILLQDNFSGRAEIGLTGDDDLHIKTSADGSAWADALLFDRTTGAIKVNSGFFLTGDISPAQIAADQNDYNPSGLSGASVLRLTTDASRGLTGLSGGGDGRVIAIVNVGANDIVLKDQNTSSSAANRFSFGADITLASSQAALVIYDATSSRWRSLASTTAGGGGGGGGDVPADLDITLAELALGLADAFNVAQFLGSAGNRFADSFDALTYVDSGASSNLNTGTAGLLKPTGGGSPDYGNTGGTGDRTGSITASATISFDAGNVNNLIDGSQANNAYFSGGQNSGYLRWDFGSGASKIINEFKWYQDSTNAQGTWRFRGSDDASTWADLLTGIALGAGSATETFAVSNTTGYRYYQLEITSGSTSGGPYTREIEFKIADAVTDNMTALSTALTAASAPTSMKIVARAKFIDSITLNTDYTFEVSRDGGTTWTQATMNDRFTVNSLHVLESDPVDISDQPSGTSVKWRIKTLNNKAVEMHDIYLYWT